MSYTSLIHETLSIIFVLFSLVSTDNLPKLDHYNDYFLMRMCSTTCTVFETCLVKNGIPTCLRNCPRSCSTRSNPVCGTDGETYTNRCLLKMRNCNVREEIKIAQKGACPSAAPVIICVRDCSHSIRRDVCATDRQTYANFCEISKRGCLSKQSLSFVHYGACKENMCSHVKCPWGQVCKISLTRGPACFCNSDCPTKSKPVCASDGKTYYNQCHLDAENCLTGKSTRKTSNGICNFYEEKKRRIHRASVAFSPE